VEYQKLVKAATLGASKPVGLAVGFYRPPSGVLQGTFPADLDHLGSTFRYFRRRGLAATISSHILPSRYGSFGAMGLLSGG